MSLLGLTLSVLIGVSLGFFGGGGSILTVPLLVYVFGQDPKEAIAGSLLIVGIASISAAIQHWRLGNVRLAEGAIFGTAGMAGAYLGGRAGAFMDGGLLLLLFAAMMVVTSLAMWRGPRAPGRSGSRSRAPGKLAAQGLAVGSFTGLVGAGGGFLIVPALALWAGLPISAAVGTSLFVIVGKSATGFAGYASHVRIDPSVIGAVAAAAVAGSFVGSRLAHRVDPASLRRAFAGFVLAMAVLILAREGALVAETASAALPATAPQLLFALLMLAVGVLAGRATLGGETLARPELEFREGDGI